MTLSVEATELVEHFQWATSEESLAFTPQKRAEVADEIADALIYLTELAYELDINPIAAAHTKPRTDAGPWHDGGALCGSLRVTANAAKVGAGVTAAGASTVITTRRGESPFSNRARLMKGRRAAISGPSHFVATRAASGGGFYFTQYSGAVSPAPTSIGALGYSCKKPRSLLSSNRNQ